MKTPQNTAVWDEKHGTLEKITRRRNNHEFHLDGITYLLHVARKTQGFWPEQKKTKFRKRTKLEFSFLRYTNTLQIGGGGRDIKYSRDLTKKKDST